MLLSHVLVPPTRSPRAATPAVPPAPLPVPHPAALATAAPAEVAAGGTGAGRPLGAGAVCAEVMSYGVVTRVVVVESVGVNAAAAHAHEAVTKTVSGALEVTGAMVAADDPSLGSAVAAAGVRARVHLAFFEYAHTDLTIKHVQRVAVVPTERNPC
jgi:hypothetical protein